MELENLFFLYIRTSPSTWELQQGQFDSKIEARQYAESNWTGAEVKTLTASEAVAEQERIQRKQERNEKFKKAIVEGAKKLPGDIKRTAKNILSKAESEAVSRGMVGYSSPPSSPRSSGNYGRLRQMDEHIRSRSPNEKHERASFIQTPKRGFTFNPPESMVRPSKREFNPPASLIKPSKHSLNPPKIQQRSFGLNFQHSQQFRVPFRSIMPGRNVPQSQPVKVKHRVKHRPKPKPKIKHRVIHHKKKVKRRKK